MNFLTTAITDIGTQKETNQDSLLIKTANTQIGKVAFAVICDGMGGLAKGEIASATVISTFKNWFSNDLPVLINSGLTDDAIKNQWTSIVRKQNHLIMNFGKNHGYNLGTTVCAILITENRYYCMNIGDSRCYEISDSLKQLTKDQTLVQREYEAGRITFDELKIDPRRNVLLQCVGCSEEVYPDYYFGQPCNNGVYVLCSDGFRHEITENEIFSLLNPNCLFDRDSMNSNISALIEKCKQRGETDNITALALRVF